MTDLPVGSSVEDLVRRARTGSPAAFEELVARYESPLLNFLLRRTSNVEDAEEIAQDAFVRAWRKLDSYDARWSFSTWLYTLAGRLASTRMRSTSPPAKGSESLEEVPVQADPGLDLAQTEERANLWSIVDRILEEDQRSALWLRYAEDLGIGEIAEVLGRSPVAVRVMLFRARARLGQHLARARAEPHATAPLAPAPQWKKVGI